MGLLRAKVILKYSIVGIVGAALGSALTLWAYIEVQHALGTAATLAAAQIIGTTDDEDEAAMLLSQAVARDSSGCEPYEMLGTIFWHKGDRKLGLELFKRALEVRDSNSWVFWDPFGGLRCVRAEREDIGLKIEAIQMGLEFPGWRDVWRWWALRAKVYWHRGKKELALKLYDLAFKECDKQKCGASDRESISKDIDALQTDLKAQPQNSERR